MSSKKYCCILEFEGQSWESLINTGFARLEKCNKSTVALICFLPPPCPVFGSVCESSESVLASGCLVTEVSWHPPSQPVSKTQETFSIEERRVPPTHWVSIISNSIPLHSFYETQPSHKKKQNIKIVSQEEIPEYKGPVLRIKCIFV